jgi:hypothetical protein
MKKSMNSQLFAKFAALVATFTVTAHTDLLADAPHHEHGYANGHVITISVKDPIPGRVAAAAQNNYYEVFYPIGWPELTESIPQCNPCDHLGDGDDFSDYHDHVFAGEPSAPRKGTYGPLWRLNLVMPAYTGETEHDLAVSAAYAAFLPITSEGAALALLEATMEDGSPIAVMESIDYVFLAAIVSSSASGH